MNNILRKNLIAIILSVITLILIFGGVLFFVKKMNIKILKVIDMKEQIQAYQKNKKAFTQQSEKVKSLEKEISLLESKVVTKETVPNLLSDFEKIAQNNNINFEITSVQTPVIEEKEGLFIDFVSKGSYEDIDNFLKDLQHQDFQVNFSKIFLFSEKLEINQDPRLGTLSVDKTKRTRITDKNWQAIVSIKILSF